MSDEPLSLSRVRALVEAATPEPWAYENCGEKENDWIVGVAYRADTEEPVSGLIDQAHEYDEESGDFIETVIRSSTIGGDLMTGKDAAFIAAARTLVPQMADVVERLARALELPPIFYAGGRPNVERWVEITGTREMTTKVMCDHIRAALALVTLPRALRTRELREESDAV